jgi:hypothetical protein
MRATQMNLCVTPKVLRATEFVAPTRWLSSRRPPGRLGRPLGDESGFCPHPLRGLDVTAPLTAPAASRVFADVATALAELADVFLR